MATDKDFVLTQRITKFAFCFNSIKIAVGEILLELEAPVNLSKVLLFVMKK